MALKDLALAKGIQYGAAIWNNAAQLGNATYMGNVNTDCSFDGFENDLKPGYVMAVRGSLNFTKADLIAISAAINGKNLYLNALVWGNYAGLPPWLRTASIPASQLQPLMVQYVQGTIAHFKGRSLGVHVVNEQFANGPNESGCDAVGMRKYSYGNTAQPIPWYVIPDYDVVALLAAKDVDPNCPLGINDYAFEIDGEDWRREKCLTRIQYIKSKGCRLDFLGSQTHIRAANWAGVSGPKFNQFVNDLASMGVKTHITELDYEAGSEARLAEILDVVRSNPNITLVQAWEYGGPGQYNEGYQTISAYGSSWQRTALYSNLASVFTNAVQRVGAPPVVTPPPTTEPPPMASPEGTKVLVTDNLTLTDKRGVTYAWSPETTGLGWTIPAGHKAITNGAAVQQFTSAVVMYLHNGDVWQTNQVELGKASTAQIWWSFGDVTAKQAAVTEHTGSPIPAVVVPPTEPAPINRPTALAQWQKASDALTVARTELDKLKPILA